MSLFRKLLNLFGFGKKEVELTSDGLPKEEVLVTFGMRKYPRDENSWTTYQFILDNSTNEIYLTPNTNGKLLAEIVRKCNKMIEDTGTRVLDDVSVNCIIGYIYGRLNTIFVEQNIFRDKGAKIIEEE